MSYCCGHVAGHEKEELTTDVNPGLTTDFVYDFINSVDYSDFPEAEPYIPNKASGTGQLNLLLLLGLAVLQIWH